MNVETMLTRKGADVFTIEPDTSIADAIHILKEKRVGALVVSEDGQSLAGILSERDIVHHLADKGAALLDSQVRDLMTPDVRTCELADTAREVLAVMTDRRIRHLPVVENGRLCGLISIGDAVKIRLDEATAEADALREYITRA